MDWNWMECRLHGVLLTADCWVAHSLVTSVQLRAEGWAPLQRTIQFKDWFRFCAQRSIMYWYRNFSLIYIVILSIF